MQAFVSFQNNRDKYNAYCIWTDNTEKIQKIFHAYFAKKSDLYLKNDGQLSIYLQLADGKSGKYIKVIKYAQERLVGSS